ncbi:hypothetical protein LDENG_00043810, partial [Lucifuga dentata]
RSNCIYIQNGYANPKVWIVRWSSRLITLYCHDLNLLSVCPSILIADLIVNATCQCDPSISLSSSNNDTVLL